MRYRLVHSQIHKGTILIDSGIPNEFGIPKSLPVYLPYYKTFFVTDDNGMATVRTDIRIPGFIDLVPSDDVKLSADRGRIKGLEVKGIVSVIEIPTGALGAPTIATATLAGNGDVTLTGTNFVSYTPDISTIIVVGYDLAGTERSVELEHDGTAVVVTTTSIFIDKTAHDFDLVRSVAVISNGVRVSRDMESASAFSSGFSNGFS